MLLFSAAALPLASVISENTDISFVIWNAHSCPYLQEHKIC